MTIYPRFFVAALLLPAALCAQAPDPPGWAANIHTSATATASWVENISRTSHHPTMKDTATYELALALTSPRQLAPAWLAQVGLDATYFHEPEFNRNDTFTAGPRTSLQYKFGVGPYAPVLQANLTALYQAARYTGQSGWTAQGGLRLAKRFGPAVRVAGFADWREHHARSAVFDVQQQTMGVEASWDISERWRLSGSTARLTGEIVANAAPDIWAQAISGGLGATVFDYYTTIPWTVTRLYGPGWVSYNVFAHVDLWSAGLAYQLAERTSLEFTLRGAYVVSRIDVRYPTRTWGLNLNHRF